jgi:uncharacterized Ntn-hydrolase superfamily protein
MPKPSTFSIVACDLKEQSWGIAVASKFPAVGAFVPWAKADSGAVATQSFVNTTYGPRGLELMAEGLSASQALSQLLANDPGREQRQVGIVDAKGGSATFSGKECSEWAGGIAKPGYAIQGNILAGSNVVPAMETAFLSAQGDLADRLYAALLAGDHAGGDKRGRQSAAILVVKPQGGYAGFNDRMIDYRVDDHPDPVTRLGELLHLYRLYFGHSPESKRITIDDKVTLQLQKMMTQLGYYKGNLNGLFDPATRDALREFIGNENFEERVDLSAGWVDQPVFDYLISKFGEQ